VLITRNNAVPVTGSVSSAATSATPPTAQLLPPIHLRMSAGTQQKQKNADQVQQENHPVERDVGNARCGGDKRMKHVMRMYSRKNAAS